MCRHQYYCSLLSQKQQKIGVKSYSVRRKTCLLLFYIITDDDDDNLINYLVIYLQCRMFIHQSWLRVTLLNGRHCWHVSIRSRTSSNLEERQSKWGWVRNRKRKRFFLKYLDKWHAVVKIWNESRNVDIAWWIFSPTFLIWLRLNNSTITILN